MDVADFNDDPDFDYTPISDLPPDSPHDRSTTSAISPLVPVSPVELDVPIAEEDITLTTTLLLSSEPPLLPPKVASLSPQVEIVPSEITSPLPQVETIPPPLEAGISDVLRDSSYGVRDAMATFEHSLRSSGSDMVCRMLMSNFLLKVSAFSYQDRTTLRNDLVKVCVGLRRCKADPSGIERVVLELLSDAELLQAQMTLPQDQLATQRSQVREHIEKVRTGLQAHTTLRDGLVESRTRIVADLESAHVRVLALEDELASWKMKIEILSGDLASVEASLSASVAEITSFEEDLVQAENAFQATPDPVLIAEAQQRFTAVQQALRDLVSEHGD